MDVTVCSVAPTPKRTPQETEKRGASAEVACSTRSYSCASEFPIVLSPSLVEVLEFRFGVALTTVLQCAL